MRGIRELVAARKVELAHIAILVALTTAVYVPSLGNGFIWDDDNYVTHNLVLQRPHALRQIWFSYETPQYYPVVFTSFLIERGLWGSDPFGYHAVNLALQAANAILLYLVLRRLARPLAFACALVFAVHPVQVETVAWITERKNLLAAFFYFLAILLFLDYRRSDRRGSYALAFLSFLLALLSKTVTACFVVLPLVVRWWKKEEIRPKHLLELVPFALAGLALGLNTVFVEIHRVGASGEKWTLSALDHLVLAGRIIAFYLYKLVAPLQLVFFYPRWEIGWREPLQWLPALAFAGALVALFHYRERIGRGAVAMLAYFVVSLVPALGFFSVYPMMYSWVADHFQYVASPAGILLVVSAAAALFGSLARSLALGAGTRRAAAYLLLGIAVTLLGSKTVAHSRSFRDSETLWKSVIAENPRGWMAFNNLGAMYMAQGKADEAMETLRNAVSIKHDIAEAHSNIGLLLMQQGKNEEAALALQEAIRVDPSYSNAHNNLGLVLLRAGKIEEATGQFQEAVRLNPRLSPAHYNLGNTFARKRLYDKAIEEYRAAVEWSPADADAHGALGLALATTGRNDEAIREYGVALELEPASGRTHYRLGELYRTIGRQEDARSHFARARELGFKLPPDAESLLSP